LDLELQHQRIVSQLTESYAPPATSNNSNSSSSSSIYNKEEITNSIHQVPAVLKQLHQESSSTVAEILQAAKQKASIVIQQKDDDLDLLRLVDELGLKISEAQRTTNLETLTKTVSIVNAQQKCIAELVHT
jgi:hypothetical protein